MIVYLDASALAKLCVEEAGSRAVAELADTASLLGTALLTLVEVTAAIARAARRHIIGMNEAEACLHTLLEQWGQLHRLQVADVVVRRATALAWDFGLRGYDAIHLACAVAWQELIGQAVTVATYDRVLWEAAHRSGLGVWPTASE